MSVKSKTKPARRTVRFPGIVADARTLAVRREHLWQVLTGRRDSLPLLRRYRALKKGRY